MANLMARVTVGPCTPVHFLSTFSSVTEEKTGCSGSADSLARLRAHQVSPRLRKTQSFPDAGTKLGGLVLPKASVPDSPDTEMGA